MSSAIGWTGLALVASTVYQQHQASEQKKKMQEREQAQKAASDAAEDAAKGAQLVVSGKPSILSVPYGRVLVGGSRVYHNTVNNYVYAAPSATNFPWTFSSEGGMDSSQSGDRHEFLITQQAICYAGINAVYNVIVNDRRINGEWVDSDNNVVASTFPGAKFINELKQSVRVSIGNGTAANELAIANDTGRSTALFTNAAYATAVFKLNRDNPQYNGVPDLQFVIEGMKVAPIIGAVGNRSLGTKVYSNNPALCILDYLTNAVYGLGMSIDSIDLDTFYEAYAICDKTVMANVPKQGAFWDLKSGQRDIKLYECNLALPSDGTLRDNLSLLLETMGDASLVWSGGKYKLVVHYPTIYSSAITYSVGTVVQKGVWLYRCVNTSLGHDPELDTAGVYWVSVVSATITDDDIIRDAATSLTWPNAQTRLNFATVKFINESKDFKEDTVTWPLKSSAVYTQYLAEDSGILLETEHQAQGLTTAYAALARAESLVRSSRNSITYEISVGKKFFKVEPGDIIHLQSDVLGIPGDLLRVTDVTPGGEGVLKLSALRFDANTLAWNVIDTEPAVARKVFNTIVEQATGVAFSNSSAALVDAGGIVTWNYPSDNRVVSFEVMYSQGTVDANTVWVSLGSVRRGVGSQGVFNLPAMIYQTFNLTIVASTLRNSAPQTAWPVISVDTGQISNPAPQVVRLRLYKKSVSAPAVPSGGVYNFAARTLSGYDAGWSLLVPTGSGDTWASDSVAMSPTGASSSNLLWSPPVVYLTGSLEVKTSSNLLGVSQRPDGLLNYTSAVANATLISGGADVTALVGTTFAVEKMTNCEAVINTAQGANKGQFSVISLYTETASFVVTATYNSVTVRTTVTVKLAGAGYVKDIRVPPTPTGITIDTTSDVLFITQTTPDYTLGRGHARTEIYLAVGINASSSASTKVDEFSGDFYTIPVAPSVPQTVFFKWVTKDGISSVISTGINFTASQITGTQISDSAISTPKLAADAVTASKIKAGEISAVHIVANGITADKIDSRNLSIKDASGNIIFAAGTLMTVGNISTYLANGAIGNTQIGGNLFSTNWDGSSGWLLDRAGNFYANNGNFRGDITGASGTFSGAVSAGSVNFASSVGTTVTYTTAGTYTLTVPAGMTAMRLSLQAGGGGGGGQNAYGYGYAGSGGGGGGGYATAVFTVTPGATYTLVVGAGGSGGVYGGGGSAGGNTYVTGLLTVTGGGGGGASIGSAYPGAGGSAGGAYATAAGTAPSAGGNSKMGVGGPIGAGSGYSQVVYPGSGYGSGGGGTIETGYGKTGGAGARGWAQVEYFDPAGVVLKAPFDTLKTELRSQGLTLS